jgi:hypothetical protein
MGGCPASEQCRRQALLKKPRGAGVLHPTCGNRRDAIYSETFRRCATILTMKLLNRLIASALILVLLPPPQLCHAWSEGGHHLIAAVAFSLLSDIEKTELLQVQSNT